MSSANIRAYFLAKWLLFVYYHNYHLCHFFIIIIIIIIIITILSVIIIVVISFITTLRLYTSMIILLHFFIDKESLEKELQKIVATLNDQNEYIEK